MRREYGGVMVEQSFSGKAVCVARCLRDDERLHIIADLREAIVVARDMAAVHDEQESVGDVRAKS